MQEKHCKNWTKPELGFQQGTCTGNWKLTGKYIISIEKKRKNYEKNKTQKRSKKRNKKGIWGATLKVGNFIASSS